MCWPTTAVGSSGTTVSWCREPPGTEHPARTSPSAHTESASQRSRGANPPRTRRIVEVPGTVGRIVQAMKVGVVGITLQQLRFTTAPCQRVDENRVHHRSSEVLNRGGIHVVKGKARSAGHEANVRKELLRARDRSPKLDEVQHLRRRPAFKRMSSVAVAICDHIAKSGCKCVPDSLDVFWLWARSSDSRKEACEC